MTGDLRVPAAQYLRMSTEHQQYSIQNQSVAIQVYAESHGFEVVQTYSDAAKSGLVVKHRAGLQQLLQDVVSGKATYRAILVYDVSRWGRFQDTDESAHYEFLCKSAGVPVHYCAEQFVNDGSLPSLIMKALKRTMAGEYSRELSAKVFAGQRRLTLLGFRVGGVAGYGLRRMLVSSTGVRKHELAFGERKNIASDRVILVPGPSQETEIVKRIYRMLISEKRTIPAIARRLNNDKVPRPGHAFWDKSAVRIILTHPKYTGCAVFGRLSKKLHGPTVYVPRADWIVKPGAFEPVIDLETFEAAQKAISHRNFQRTDEELLDDLRALLKAQGRLSLSLIKNSPYMRAPGTYWRRFGNLRNAYKLIGYEEHAYTRYLKAIETRSRTMAIQKDLVARIAAMFPNEVAVVSPAIHWRRRLRLFKRFTVSVIVVRNSIVYKTSRKWILEPTQYERNFITLVARLNETNTEIFDLRLFERINHAKRLELHRDDPWMRRGWIVTDLSQFCKVAKQVWLAWLRRSRKRT